MQEFLEYINTTTLGLLPMDYDMWRDNLFTLRANRLVDVYLDGIYVTSRHLSYLDVRINGRLQVECSFPYDLHRHWALLKLPRIATEGMQTFQLVVKDFPVLTLDIWRSWHIRGCSHVAGYWVELDNSKAANLYAKALSTEIMRRFAHFGVR